MDLNEAAEQFVDMVKLGLKALERMAETQTDEAAKAAIRKASDEVCEKAEQLKKVIRGSNSL